MGVECHQLSILKYSCLFFKVSSVSGEVYHLEAFLVFLWVRKILFQLCMLYFSILIGSIILPKTTSKEWPLVLIYFKLDQNISERPSYIPYTTQVIFG